MTHTIKPYLPGHGPEVTFTFRDGSHGGYDGDVSDDTGAVRFTFRCYRVGLGRNYHRSMCEDVASFALAYVERPDEFGREPDDTEQIHAAWWRQHGDAIMSAFLPDDGE